MPDLNLIDEGGFDESPAPAAPPAKKKSSGGGGGGGTKILLILTILILIGAGVYFLNQRGIIKLWGKKRPPVMQMQEEPFPQEPTEQVAQSLADTSVALLETPPIDEKAEAAKEPEAIATEPSVKEQQEEIAETEPASKLSEMRGEFTIQVIAYRERKKAAETSKNLEIAGYPSFVEKVPMKGGDWYTVRIGRYPSRVEAQRAVKTFAAQLQAHYVIDKIRTK